jgi:hypothetical protein
MSLVVQDKKDMQQEWNARAAHDPFFYVETTHWDGNVDLFLRSARTRPGFSLTRFDNA